MGGDTGAQFLHNFSHDKLVEEVHQQSVWTVLPVNHILGKLLLSPTTCLERIKGREDLICVVDAPNGLQLGTRQRIRAIPMTWFPVWTACSIVTMLVNIKTKFWYFKNMYCLSKLCYGISKMCYNMSKLCYDMSKIWLAMPKICYLMLRIFLSIQNYVTICQKYVMFCTKICLMMSKIC